MKKKLLLTSSLVICCFPFVARAEAPCEVAETEENVLALSQVAVSESGWHGEADHSAIMAVLCDVKARAERRAKRRGRVRSLTLAWAARRYSPYATGRWVPHQPRHVWIRNLSLSGDVPQGFPEHLNWERHRAWWMAVLERSRQLIRGEISHACQGPVHHWGGAMDRHRAVRGRFVAVDCGETLNEYWRYPSGRGRVRLARRPRREPSGEAQSPGPASIPAHIARGGASRRRSRSVAD